MTGPDLTPYKWQDLTLYRRRGKTPKLLAKQSMFGVLNCFTKTLNKSAHTQQPQQVIPRIIFLKVQLSSKRVVAILCITFHYHCTKSKGKDSEAEGRRVIPLTALKNITVMATQYCKKTTSLKHHRFKLQ